MAEQQITANNQADGLRVRNFCFTDFNTTDEHIQLMLLGLKYTYLVIGREVCPKTQRQHLQCYCELSGQLTIRKIKSILGNVHIEARRGTGTQAANYCKKEGNFMEYGELKSQGKRTDLKAIRKVFEIGGTLEDIILDGADLNQLKYAQIVLPFLEAKRDWKPEVYWFHGRSGSGKTRLAVALAGDGYYMKDNTKWWNGYDGHDRVVIDELRPAQFPLEYLLRLLDRYPFTIEHKGGNRQFVAQKIWITSPMSPKDFCEFCARSEDEAQLLRRIDHVLDFNNPEISAMALEKPPEN